MRRLNDGTPIMEFKTEEDIHLAKSYFGTLREFLDEIKEAYNSPLNLPEDDINAIFDKYQIEFVDIGDGIPRISIDNPNWRKK